MTERTKTTKEKIEEVRACLNLVQEFHPDLNRLLSQASDNPDPADRTKAAHHAASDLDQMRDLLTKSADLLAEVAREVSADLSPDTRE